MSTKKFLYLMLALYVGGAVVGIALFRTPSYSRQYLAKYGRDHERYRKIMKNEEYKAYIERPNLHPADARLLADAAFMKDYEGRSEFRAEKRRIFAYSGYFKVLNSVVFILLLGRALRKPVLEYLDGRIHEIRTELDAAARARTEAQQAKAGVLAKVDHWSAIEADLRKQTDETMQQDLAAIHAEFDHARAQLEKETADRKQFELLRASRRIKEELVSQAIKTLEQRYRTEATSERLARNVDRFVRLMDRLS
jgi:F0F1-type ATP synthase membrane subunit b/b'